MITLSIGSQDLFDEGLVTLKEASLEDLKIKNKSKLKEKAGHIKAMIQKLIKLGMKVIYIVPVTCIRRKEVFDQFEEIVLETFDSDLTFPDFKLLNLPELMYYKNFIFYKNISFKWPFLVFVSEEAQAVNLAAKKTT